MTSDAELEEACIVGETSLKIPLPIEDDYNNYFEEDELKKR